MENLNENLGERINGLLTSQSMKDFVSIVEKFASIFAEFNGDFPNSLVRRISVSSDKEVHYWAQFFALGLVDEGETITVNFCSEGTGNDVNEKIGVIGFDDGCAYITFEENKHKKFYLNDQHIERLFQTAYSKLIN
ncbi:hypothetical protein [Domibacillus mangrovi]|uniref:Uncharacterized protein n=1 Tax=Domibacillus mangrovi TaxID=1714354 RepID=A0A1Q5P058_9BACI|nr:hypothetical protein [Domibacillus mangrovi]OKL35492.1 hypothetical protein BLL40_15145 [Domibacillus mangrovi]